jgi:hypothetical protein
MELVFKARSIAASICLVTLSGMVYADDTVVNLELPTDASFYTKNIQATTSQTFNPPAYLLAANDSDAVLGQTNVTPHPATEF